MKKVLLFVVLAALLTVSGVFAQGGIQIIDPQGNNSSNVDYLDDVKPGVDYKIDDWGILKIIYNETWDANYNDVGYRKGGGHDGNDGADTPILGIEVTNITFTPKNFLKEVKAKIVYDNQYEINGWWLQFSCIKSASYYSAKDCYVKASDVFEIDPFYAGYYMFGAKIPTYIVNDSKPLRMEIALDGVELTYNIRK